MSFWSLQHVNSSKCSKCWEAQIRRDQGETLFSLIIQNGMRLSEKYKTAKYGEENATRTTNVAKIVAQDYVSERGHKITDHHQ